MTKPQLKQQRLEVPAQSPNRRTKKKQRGSELSENTDDIDDKMVAVDPKVLFTGIGAEVQSLFQQPNDERWRKLPVQVKDKAKPYTLTSRFVPKAEATDGISCHNDFAGAARLYLFCHQIQTSTPTKTASDIQVVQWKQFFLEVLSGPTTLIGKTKLQKGESRRRETVQFMTNLCHSDPLLLFATRLRKGLRHYRITILERYGQQPSQYWEAIILSRQRKHQRNHRPKRPFPSTCLRR